MENEKEQLMRECIQLAQAAADAGDPPFGSILVLDGKVVIRAKNTANSESNFLLHGEMNALKQALERYSLDEISNMTIFASSEPCPMCAGAIYWSGIKKVFYGTRRTILTEIRGFGLNVACEEILSKGSRRVELEGPILEDEICKIYENFYKKS